MAGVECGPIVDPRWNSRFTRRRVYRVQKRGIESVYKKERERMMHAQDAHLREYDAPRLST